MTELLSFLAPIGRLLLFVLGFTFLIFIHELGHFLAAKWSGIKVTQFAIGMGQAMMSWRKGIGFRAGSTEAEYEKRVLAHIAAREKQVPGTALHEKSSAEPKPTLAQFNAAAAELGLSETEYRLNWLPLGGYVKMLGQEDLNPDAVSEDPRSFGKASFRGRALVISAGVIMNLIFGFLLFVIAFKLGVAFPPQIIGDVVDGSPAAVTYANGYEGKLTYKGLQPGDRVTQINDQPTTDFMDIAVSTALAAPDTYLKFTVERDGEKSPLIYHIKPKRNNQSRLLSLGVEPTASRKLAESELALSDDMKAAGVKPGWEVVAVDGQPIERYDQYQRLVGLRRGEASRVTFKDPASSATADVTVHAAPRLSYRLSTDEERGERHLLGLVPAARIDGIVPDSPADRAGLHEEDQIARVGQEIWPNVVDIVKIVQRAEGAPISVSVRRGDQFLTFEDIKPDKAGRLGIALGFAVTDSTVGMTLPNSPAYRPLNLPAGSRIVSLNDQPIASFTELQRQLQELAGTELKSPNDTLNIKVGYQLNLPDAPPGSATLKLTEADLNDIRSAKWDAPLGGFTMLRVPVTGQTVWDAAKLGVRKTHQYMVQTYVTLARLFQGSVRLEHLRGPVGIVDEGTRIAKEGVAYLLFFLGLISVNLAVVNFLPMPIVDGGLMVFLLVEKLKGSPVSLKVQNAANIAGLVLIGSIFLITLYHDIPRLASRLLGM